VIDAESSLRGYFLHGQDAYLGPYRNAPGQVETEFDELRELLADRPSQLKNLAQLRSQVGRKLARLDEQLALYRKGGLSDIVRQAHLSDDRSAMDEIRLLVVIMVKEQNEDLAARSAVFYAQYQKAVLVGVGINATAILVLVLFYRLVRRSYFARAQVQRALEDANDNLESMVVLRTEQLAVLSRHLINVSEEEKARLARELHDEMGAKLTAISMDLSSVSARIEQRGEPALANVLGRARSALLDAVELKRRIVEDLRPSLLDNLGLSAALESYCAEFAGVSGLDCEVLVDGDVDSASPTHAIAVFRIVQEALNNVAKYAQAHHVIVQLCREGEALSLQVMDDGIGIDLEATRKPKSHGLLGMRERALLLNGKLSIGRGVQDKGTCIDALIPLADPSSANPPPADGHTPSLLPYSTLPHSAPSPVGPSL
jgi:signal transduction histidine kinase